jgi:UDP-N-acetylmuramate dehydrogenase
MAAVREAVLGLRRGKGMVLDPDDHDTWSAGSFFTNPLLTEAQAAGLPADAPRWAQDDGTVKTSAAWLIEHAGFTQGTATARRPCRHTLALTTGEPPPTTSWRPGGPRRVRDGSGSPST